MSASARDRVRRIRESFWFVPVSIVLLGVVLAELAVAVDRWAGTSEWAHGAGGILSLGVGGSRGILTTVGGSMIAVAATSFSITISVIATASSTYGPRLVRNFMSDRRNQLVLGTFVATFVYCLLVLRAVSTPSSSSGQEFIPYLAIHLAIAIAIADVAALVYFIHHIADSIQVSTLVQRVRDELDRAVAGQYPERSPGNAVAADPVPRESPVVTAGRPGYVVWVDEEALTRLAAEHDGVIQVIATVGTHVLSDEPVVRTTCDAEAVTAGVRRSVAVDDARTPDQDVRFAVQQLVEVAVRALSAGTNDPYTARNAVSELGAGLCRLARAGAPPLGRTDPDGHLRLVVSRAQPVDIVDGVFDDLRMHGSGEAYVVRAAVKLAGRLAATGNAAMTLRARRHVDLMLDAFASGSRPAFDVERLQQYADEHLDDGLSVDGGPARA